MLSRLRLCREQLLSREGRSIYFANDYCHDGVCSTRCLIRPGAGLTLFRYLPSLVEFMISELFALYANEANEAIQGNEVAVYV